MIFLSILLLLYSLYCIAVNHFSLLIFLIIVSKQIASYTLPVTREVYNCRFLTILNELKFKKKNYYNHQTYPIISI